MRRAASIFTVLFLIAILSTSQGPSPGPPDLTLAPASPQSGPWWNVGWRFRTPLTMMMPQAGEENQTLLVFVQIPYGHSLDAFHELRVIDQNFQEVPSAVLYEQKQSVFTVGVAILFSVSANPGDFLNFGIYYGNPSANPPPYRQTTIVQNYDNGQLAAGLRDMEISLSYRGESYTNFYTTKFRYNNTSQNDYGSVGELPIARWRIDKTLTWHLDQANNATFSLGMAGTLVVLRVLKSERKTLQVSDMVLNSGPYETSNVRMFDLFDARDMARRGLVAGGFNVVDNIAFASVGSSMIGAKGEQGPNSFSVGFWQSIYAQTNNTALSGSPAGTGDIAVALEWNLGNVQSGGKSILSRHFTFGPSYSNLTQSLSQLVQRPTLSLLAEEAQSSTVPTAATLLVNSHAQNLTVGQSGYMSSYAPPSNGWVVTEASVDGEASYALPGLGEYDFESSTIWTVTSTRPGTSIAFSSAHTWSEERQSYTAAVRLWDNDASVAPPQGSVSSKFINVVGAETLSLSFAYRLKISDVTGAGNFFGGFPSAYVVFLADDDLDSVADSIFYISGTGTIPGSNSTFPSLLNDGAWHNSTIPLVGLPRDFRFAITIHANTNGGGPSGQGNGAKGVVELEVDSISLRVEGRAEDMLTMRLDPYTQTFSLNYARQGLNTPPLDSLAKVTLRYLIAAPIPVTIEPKGLFSARFTQQAPGSLTFADELVVVLGIQPSAFTSASLNNIQLTKPLHYNVTSGTLIVHRAGFETVAGQSIAAPFNLAITNTYKTLTVEPRDANGDPVPNLTFAASDAFGREFLRNASASSTLDLTLIPFSYTLNGIYHGVTVYTGSMDVADDATQVLDLPVFRTTFTVRDVFRFPLTGAEVRFERNSTELYRATADGSGQVSAQLASSTQYTLIVSYQGERLLEQGFTASLNNLTVDLATSYTPFATRVAVAVTIIAAALAVIVLSRRRLKL